MSILIQQIEELLKEPSPIAALGNVSACLFQSLPSLNWAGFYLVQKDELVLGPFQGTVACTHIPLGKGFCGICAETKTVQRIADVTKHAEHIACDANSRSELVVPILVKEKTVAVLDMDAPILNRFTKNDEKEMLQVAEKVSQAWLQHSWNF